MPSNVSRYSPHSKLFFAKGLLLFLFPLPILGALVVSLAKGNMAGVLGDACAGLLFFVGALSMRRGLAIEEDYRHRSIAVPPKIPFKTVGGVAVAVATAIAAYYGAGHSVGIALSFAVGAFAGCYLTYGSDPSKAKGPIAAHHAYTTEEVINALQDATQRVKQIERANREIHNQEMHNRLRRIVESTHKILQLIEEDPRDLRRARKFLNTYLEGTQRITEGYVKMTQQTHSDALAENFRNVLVTIEDVFQEQHRKLLENDVLDLDVQIEVLATQLKREGVN